jgi:hypothetical protein
MGRGTGRTDGVGGPVWPKTTGRRAFLKGAGAASAVGLASSVLRSNNARATTAPPSPTASGSDASATGSGSGWSLVQKPADSATGSNTFASPTTEGNLLVAWVSSKSDTAFTGPSGWTRGPSIANAAVSEGQWWFYYNNPGSLTGPFTWSGPSGTIDVAIAEFTCTNVSMVARPSDSGTGTAGATASVTVSTANGTAHSGDLVLAGFQQTLDTASAITWTAPSGFTALATHSSNSSTFHDSAWYNLSSGSAGVQTVTGTSSVTSADPNAWAGAVVTFTEPVQASFPSVLATSGRNIVDANGYTMPLLKGFDVQAQVGWSLSNFQAMASEGAQIVRLVTFWDDLEPNKGSIDTTSFIPNMDASVANAAQAGLYVIINLYFGPNGVHMPSWADQLPPNGYAVTASPASAMANYCANGQNSTQYLANRYGNPSSAEYSAAVIGFQVNEPTPDGMEADSWLNLLMAEQVIMVNWFRADAPDWIAIMSAGYGSNAILPNAPGSGQTSQTFTGAPANPLGISASTTVASGSNGAEPSTWTFSSPGTLSVASTSGFLSGGVLNVAASGSATAVITYTGISGNSFTGCVYISGSPTGTLATGGTVSYVSGTQTPAIGSNFAVDLHDYIMLADSTNLTPALDGRDPNGALGSNAIKVGNTNYPTYPPEVNGSTVLESICKSQQAAYLASHVDYCAAGYANVPLIIGEWGWVPVDDGTDFSGGSSLIADKLANWSTAGVCIEMQWDYAIDQSTDPYAARPGTGEGVVGADSSGWQIVTDDFFAG